MGAKKRNVLVTGGASGIGAAVAERFVDAGDMVTVFDRVASSSTQVESVIGDVRRFDDNVRAVRVACDSDGSLDVLIANAGIHDGGMRLTDASATDFEDRCRSVLDVNVLGYVFAARAAADALKQARGSIILTLSDASFDVRGNGAGIAYVVSKHAGVGVLKALARDLAPEVRVNAVAPGGVPTNLTALDDNGAERPILTNKERLRQSLANRTILGHGGDLEDLPEAYFYLSSNSAAAITGQVLRVDGGLIS